MSWLYHPLLAASQILAQLPPSVVLNSPADAATGVSTTPTLNFTGTDANGDSVEYEVQIYQSLVTDDFNRADQNPISGNWTNDALGEGSDNQLKIVSNQLKAATASTSCEAYWNANTFSGFLEQYFTVVTKPGNTQRVEMGWIQQPGSATFDGYLLSLNDNAGTDTIDVSRYDNSSGTSIGSVSYEYNAGDIVRWTKDTSGVFKVYINDILVLTTSADTTYTTGLYAEVGIRDTTGVLDNWGVRQIIVDALSASDAGFTAGHPFASGAAKEYTVQSALSNSTLYYWRVRAIDPSGSNNWGAWATARSFTTTAGGGTVVQDIIGGFGIIPFSR